MSQPVDDEIATVVAGQRESVHDLTEKAEQLLRGAQQADDFLSDEVAELLQAHGVTLGPIIPEPSTLTASRPVAAPLDWSALVTQNRRIFTETGRKPPSLDELSRGPELQAFESDWRLLVEQTTVLERQKQTETLLCDCRRRLLDAVIRPFGLGSLVAVHDRVGGNVLTPHNAERLRGSDVPESDRETFDRFHENRSEDYNSGKAYRTELPRMRKEAFKEGPISDAYTGRDLPRDGRAHLDHVVSAKDMHEDRELNFFMSQGEKRTLAQDPENLAFTSESINASKGEKPMEEWMDATAGGRDIPNADHYGVDRGRGRTRDERARQHRADKLSEKQREYYVPRVVRSGVIEAGKMGLQQAIGVVLVELVAALLDEAMAVWRDGWNTEGAAQSWLDVLLTRLERVGSRVLASLKPALKAAAGGAVSGFLSNLLTVLINTVRSTSRRVVRIIREGLFSLLRAVRLLALPPDGMTAADAAHEASKLLTSGVLVGFGIAVQEPLTRAAQSSLAAVPVLVPFIDPAVEIGVGLAVGVMSAVVVYALDQVDLFGSVATREAENCDQHLLHHLDEELSRLEQQLS